MHAIARAETFPQDVGAPWERSAHGSAPRGLGRTSRRTGDLAARTYPVSGDDHPIRMMSALCALA